MITIITALYSEAKPFLSALPLKKNTASPLLVLFEGEGIRLLITGVGEFAACMAVTRYFTLFPPQKTDIAVNIGLAGCLPASDTDALALPALGSCHLAIKLSETSTGRTFYPDLLYPNSFSKAELFTVPSVAAAHLGQEIFPATQANPIPACKPSSAILFQLVDMEAAGIYQAALPYLSTERIFFFKVVSDYGISPKEQPVISKGQLDDILPEALIAPHASALLTFAKQVQNAVLSEPSNHPILFSSEEQDSIERLLVQLPITASMQQDLLHQLRYYKLCGNSVSELLAAFLDSLPSVPPHGKKQVKPYLDSLTRQILAGSKKAALPHSLSPSDRSDNAAKKESFYLPFFSALYIEEELLEQRSRLIPKQLTARINAAKEDTGTPIAIIPVRHYKDVFNRSRQNLVVQKQTPSLILANNHGTLLYPGAPVCQSFGNRYFYYASNLMNCIYHCDYCYLQGMYPSGHIVAFLNLEDYFTEVTEALKKHPMYLCISYDTDLLALEPLFHFVEQWVRFAKHHPDLTLEIRTKSGNPELFSMLRRTWNAEQITTSGNFTRPAAQFPIRETEDATQQSPERLIFAWTVSPEQISLAAEHGAAPLSARLKALKAAKCAGFSVRLCFDPMIYCPGWQEAYQELVRQIFEQFTPKLLPEELLDVSIGVFRISTEYLKAMRKKRPDSPIVQFPYVSEHGVSHYGNLSEKMVQYLYQLLLPYLPPERIFVWDGKGTEQPQKGDMPQP